MKCPTCQGSPHRRDQGCARCDDTGVVDEPGVEGAAKLDRRTFAKACRAVHAALTGLGMVPADRERITRIIVEGMMRGNRTPVAGIMAWTGCDEERAWRVVTAYESAVQKRRRTKAPKAEAVRRAA